MPDSSRAPGPDKKPQKPTSTRPAWLRWLLRVVLWITGLGAAAAASAAIVLAVALAVAYPNLPDVSDLADYRPKLPLRVFSSDGVLIGEFGEERRNLTPIATVPKVMKDAVLAAEDARFYDHGGVDYKGVMRAGLANLERAKSQGASTISMQVARNVYLSSEKTLTRKVYEILLTFKLEHQLSKDQIFEIYLNQIYLGNRAYGFAAAADAYFGKPLSDITIAEAAMLAGLPKAPGANNPVNNPTRARGRQLYVIDRMVEAGFITAQQAAQAKEEKLQLRDRQGSQRLHAEFVAETVRQLMYAQYGDSTYTRGLKVYTSIDSADQTAAYEALRRGIMDYERRQFYRGPEKFVDLPTDPAALEEAIDDALAEHPDNGDVRSAIVLSASTKEVTAARANGDVLKIFGEGLKPVQSGLSDKAAPNLRIRRGAVIRVAQNGKNAWEITQLPEVEGAFVSLDPRDGAIKALVGGFDFSKNKFNHVTQAWRQPGSSFKPFIYSAAVDKGFSPSTVINDAPLSIPTGDTGGQVWEPKNYGGGYDGPMTMRRALQKSKNLVSVRILRAIGTQYAQQYITRFGFDADRHPAYLPMALGAGSVTMLQMASGYSVFANGGYRVNPYIIDRVVDARGTVVQQSHPMTAGKDAVRVIDPRNDFIMDSLLRSVVSGGTGYQAKVKLGRNDMAGKTGTTNDSFDAWFCGYTPKVVGVAWMGYDNPRSLGDRETGGGLALPIWINYMSYALKGEPQTERQPPEGVVQMAGDWAYEEYANGQGVASVGLGDAMPGASAPAGDQPQPGVNLAPTQEQEKQKILDMFRGN
ncbi:penicillin-binding protein 1A [Ralstonia sp.]|nr:penicillin-binding protein 1A [Ralstonia sp.]HWV03127.1 penicillin-binding protein 1A [Ralstonia sp.]